MEERSVPIFQINFSILKGVEGTAYNELMLGPNNETRKEAVLPEKTTASEFIHVISAFPFFLTLLYK
ncbi:hypothetical protein [Paenibacillus sp. AD87]|uniref:hypothetical protein n=1 Tax=Paenibacillus sp. AD87 TaxID=1528787 RepID=UPI0007E357D2|nr:hypothetical protein [Paenibacillus sp. AD87]